MDKTNIIGFYKEQLNKFTNKVGLGNITENGVTVTERLIETTERRLGQLKPSLKYNTNLLCANCKAELSKEEE